MKLFLLCLISSGSFAFALDFGFYSLFDDVTARDYLSSIEGSADFEIGISYSRDGKYQVSEYQCELNELGEKPKLLSDEDFVLVRLYKSIMWNEPEKIEEHIEYIKGEIKKLSYKRLVVFGAHSSGIYYLYDSAKPTANE